MDRNSLRVALTILAAVAAMSFAAESRAEPQFRIGAGFQSCEKAAQNLKVGGGLDHLPNALMFIWVQGYMSAANIHLMNEYNDYIDLGAVEEADITQLVSDFCKDNPGKRPIDAIDPMIKRRKKIEIKESDAFDPWDH